MLRIEDLDRERCRDSYAEQCLRDLEWLGLTYDGAPLYQRTRADALRACAQRLLEEASAYPCVCTQREASSLQAPQGDEPPAYPGTCRGRWNSLEQAQRESGRAAGLRLVVPSEPIAFEDGLCGAQVHRLEHDCGDFLILRKDGLASYQLAVVIDDAFQGVDEVVRGGDLLSSAARQAYLCDVLGLERPRWWHVPLVVDASGRRLAKRQGDLSLASLAARGVDPRAVVAWAIRAAWDPSGGPVPERLTPEQCLPAFRLERCVAPAHVLDAATLQGLLLAR